MTPTFLVFGSRDWKDARVIRAWLFRLPKGSRIVHGGAPGADTIAGDVAKKLGFEVKDYPVDPALDGEWPAAGVRRNQRMLDEEQHIKRGLGFSWIVRGKNNITAGSSDMAWRLLARGIVVTIVPPGEMP